MQAILSPTRTNTQPSEATRRCESHANQRAANCARRENGALRVDGNQFDPKIVLVPLTLSDGSRAAIAIARNLVRGTEAKLVLLHVVQPNVVGEEQRIPRTPLLDELYRDAEFRLRELASGMSNEEILVCQGCPAKVIVETAMRLEVDTIVMCTHGYGGWLKWVHRNTAKKVARQAPCRVWLISPAKRDATANFVSLDRAA
jgi:nucleotide-binding universal stress UspA family protein